MISYKEACSILYTQHPKIRKHQKEIFIRFFIKLIAIELLIAAFTVYLCTYTIQLCGIGIALAVLIPFFVLKPQKIFTRRLYGKIVNISYEQKRVIRHKFSTFYTDMGDGIFVVYTLQKPNGNLTQVTFEKKFEQVFQQDDIIMSVRGFPYPINFTPHDFVVCPLCSSISPVIRDTCIDCESTLPIIHKNPEK